MSINISGLNGRNVFFWRWFIPHNLYIIKYTSDGKYYAIDKLGGKLYEFHQSYYHDTDDALKIEIHIERVDYSAVRKYGIELTEENIESYIDPKSKNQFFTIGDFMSVLKNFIRIFGVALLLIFGTHSYNLTMTIGMLLFLSFFMGSYPMKIHNDERSLLSHYLPKEKIDYSVFHTKSKYSYDYEKEYGSKTYWTLISIPALLLIMTLYDSINGIDYDVFDVLTVGSPCVGFLSLGLLLKFGFKIKGLMWGVLFSLFLGILFFSAGMLFKIIIGILCVIFGTLFIYRNVVYQKLKK